MDFDKPDDYPKGVLEVVMNDKPLVSEDWKNGYKAGQRDVNEELLAVAKEYQRLEIMEAEGVGILVKEWAALTERMDAAIAKAEKLKGD